MIAEILRGDTRNLDTVEALQGLWKSSRSALLLPVRKILKTALDSGRNSYISGFD